MSESVLHHYPAFPYSEKIRAIFDLKKPKWKSVTIPAVIASARSLKDIGSGALPFMAMMAFFIDLLYLFPALVTWLPTTMAVE